jgi:hypothetical protein
MVKRETLADGNKSEDRKCDIKSPICDGGGSDTRRSKRVSKKKEMRSEERWIKSSYAWIPMTKKEPNPRYW